MTRLNFSAGRTLVFGVSAAAAFTAGGREFVLMPDGDGIEDDVPNFYVGIPGNLLDFARLFLVDECLRFRKLQGTWSQVIAPSHAELTKMTGIVIPEKCSNLQLEVKDTKQKPLVVYV